MKKKCSDDLYYAGQKTIYVTVDGVGVGWISADGKKGQKSGPIQNKGKCNRQHFSWSILNW